MAGVEEYIRQQWPVLKNRVETLEDRRRLLEAQLEEINKEIEKARQDFDAIDAAASKLNANFTLQLDINIKEQPKYNRYYQYGDVTIKQAARLTLAAYPGGLDSHNLFNALNQRYFEGKLERTSFSPQLSRMKREGEVESRNKGWVLTDRGRAIMASGPLLPYLDEPQTNEPPSA